MAVRHNIFLLCGSSSFLKNDAHRQGPLDGGILELLAALFPRFLSDLSHMRQEGRYVTLFLQKAGGKHRFCVFHPALLEDPPLTAVSLFYLF